MGTHAERFSEALFHSFPLGPTSSSREYPCQGFHFSMLEVGNSCHLQGFSALAQVGLMWPRASGIFPSHQTLLTLLSSSGMSPVGFKSLQDSKLFQHVPTCCSSALADAMLKLLKDAKGNLQQNAKGNPGLNPQHMLHCIRRTVWASSLGRRNVGKPRRQGRGTARLQTCHSQWQDHCRLMIDDR